MEPQMALRDKDVFPAPEVLEKSLGKRCHAFTNSSGYMFRLIFYKIRDSTLTFFSRSLIFFTIGI